MRYPLEVFRAVRAAWPAGEADLGPHLGQRLGRRRRRHAGGRRRDRPHAAGGRRRHLRRLGRPDLHAGEAGLRPHVPDAVLRPHPQRDRHGDDGGRQHLRARPRQLDPDGRPRRPRLPGPPASHRPLLDAPRGSALGDRAEKWPDPYLPGRNQLWRLAERTEPCWARSERWATRRQARAGDRRRQRRRRGDRRALAERRRPGDDRRPPPGAAEPTARGRRPDAHRDRRRDRRRGRARHVRRRGGAHGPADIVVANAGAARQPAVPEDERRRLARDARRQPDGRLPPGRRRSRRCSLPAGAG